MNMKKQFIKFDMGSLNCTLLKRYLLLFFLSVFCVSIIRAQNEAPIDLQKQREIAAAWAKAHPNPNGRGHLKIKGVPITGIYEDIKDKVGEGSFGAIENPYYRFLSDESSGYNVIMVRVEGRNISPEKEEEVVNDMTAKYGKPIFKTLCEDEEHTGFDFVLGRYTEISSKYRYTWNLATGKIEITYEITTTNIDAQPLFDNTSKKLYIDYIDYTKIQLDRKEAAAKRVKKKNDY